MRIRMKTSHATQEFAATENLILASGCRTTLFLRMGAALLALSSLGISARAEATPPQQGRAIRFAVAHDHSSSWCYGYLYVDGDAISYEVNHPSEYMNHGFKIQRSELQTIGRWKAPGQSLDVLELKFGKSVYHLWWLQEEQEVQNGPAHRSDRPVLLAAPDTIIAAIKDPGSVLSATQKPASAPSTSAGPVAQPPAAVAPDGLDAWKPDAQVGDLQFDVPEGWRQEQTRDGIVLVPNGLSQNSLVAITFLPPPTPGSDPYSWFRATWANWKGPLNLIDSGQPESKHDPNGFEVLSSYSRAYTPRLGNGVFILAAAVAGNQISPYFYLCNTNCGYDGYQQGFHDFELSLTLASMGTSMMNAKGPGIAGGMKGAYVTYKATEGDEALGTFKVRGHAEYLVFFPDGNVIRFLPKEGLQNFDFRAAVRRTRESCGRYRVDGDRVSITWGDYSTMTGVRNGRKLQIGDDMLPYEPLANSE